MRSSSPRLVSSDLNALPFSNQSISSLDSLTVSIHSSSLLLTLDPSVSLSVSPVNPVPAQDASRPPVSTSTALIPYTTKGFPWLPPQKSSTTPCVTQYELRAPAVSTYALITEVIDESPEQDDTLFTPEPEPTTIHLKTGKKYKPVALKTKPVLGELAEKFRIVRTIKGDPLEHLPKLSPNPPKYSPCGRYTQERKDLFDKANNPSTEHLGKCHGLYEEGCDEAEEESHLIILLIRG